MAWDDKLRTDYITPNLLIQNSSDYAKVKDAQLACGRKDSSFSVKPEARSRLCEITATNKTNLMKPTLSLFISQMCVIYALGRKVTNFSTHGKS